MNLVSLSVTMRMLAIYQVPLDLATTAHGHYIAASCFYQQTCIMNAMMPLHMLAEEDGMNGMQAADALCLVMTD